MRAFTSPNCARSCCCRSSSRRARSTAASAAVALDARLVVAVAGDELLRQQRLEPPGVIVRVAALRLQPGHLRRCRRDRLRGRGDLALREHERRLAALRAPPRTVAGRPRRADRPRCTAWLSTTFSSVSGPLTCGAIPTTFARTEASSVRGSRYAMRVTTTPATNARAMIAKPSTRPATRLTTSDPGRAPAR